MGNLKAHKDSKGRLYVDVHRAANGSIAWDAAKIHGFEPKSTMQYIGTTQRVYLKG